MSSLWIVYNGYQGGGAVAVIVSSEDEDAAIEKARRIFRLRAFHHGYPDTYWRHPTTEEIELPYECELA
jgi:hypothetical protein